MGARWSSDVNLNVFLMDPVNSPLIFPMNFQMLGNHIKVPLEKHLFSFLIRTSRSYHVEDDPAFDCREYNQEDTYGNCVKQELVKIFEQGLNCTPPLLASETDQMCNERFNVTREESARIFDLFVNNYVDFEPS